MDLTLDASAKKIIDEVFDLRGAERESAIERLCGQEGPLRARVLLLLSSAERDDPFLSEPTLSDARGGGKRAPGEGPGTRIGPYKLLEQIGEGGFGSVFMAEQTEPVRRRVALKIIKLGMDTRAVVARFEQERQALALMDHANVAKVLDAGATDTGRPFFVMELVKGKPITTFCDEANLAIPQRLELFTQVCRAVQHAHTKGLIHRDIKPGNILVSEQDGRPHCKIIDFGIAKATAQPLTEKTVFTEFRQFIGTPEYMSPEQAAGGLDVDTRSDVYSLGVLLYELLAGVTPLDPQKLRSAAYGEMQRMIREVDPPAPSTRLSQLHETLASVAALRHTEPRRLGSLIRGELDWIVMRALEKDRSRRYDSAGNFAADVQRYLDGEPVQAAPPSTVYRVRKFARRHRGLVLAGSVVGFSLVIGLGAAVWQARVAARERDAARIAAQEAISAKERADRIAEFQASQLRGIDVAEMGNRMRLDILARAGGAVPLSMMSDDQAAAGSARLESLLGFANFTDLALRTLDENIFSRALRTINEQFGEQPVVKASLLVTIAATMIELGLFEKAEAPLREGLAIRRQVLDDDDRDTIATMAVLGSLVGIRGKHGEAETILREALERARRTLGPEHGTTTDCLSRLGLLLHARGEYTEADKCFGEVLAIRRRLFGPDDLAAIRAVGNVGLVLHTRGRQSEAEPHFREAYERFRRVRGEKHVDTLRAAANLGKVLGMDHRHAEAEVILRDVLESLSALRGDDHADTLTAKSNLAVLLNAMGRNDDAQRLYTQVLEARVKLLGRLHPNTLDSLDNLGTLLADAGRYREAEPLLREALTGMEKTGGRDGLYATISRMRLGAVVGKLGHFAEGEAMLLDVQRTLGTAHGGDQFHWLDSLAELYEDWDKAEPGKGYDAKAGALREKIGSSKSPGEPR